MLIYTAEYYRISFISGVCHGLYDETTESSQNVQRRNGKSVQHL